MFYLVGGGGGRARMVQWWEHSPPTNMDRVQIPSSILLIIWWMKNRYVVRVVPLNPEFELARFYCIYLFFYFFIYFNILVTDHVNRRCGKNNGRDTGGHWISKSMYNYLDAREQSCSAGSRHWRWTSAGLVQKSFSLSPNFFYLLSKIKSH